MSKTAQTFLIICGVASLTFVSFFLLWLQPSLYTTGLSSNRGGMPKLLASSFSEGIASLGETISSWINPGSASSTKQVAAPVASSPAPAEETAYVPSPEPAALEEEPAVLGVSDEDFSDLSRRMSQVEGQLGLGSGTGAYTTSVNLIRNSSFEQNDGDAPAQWQYQLSSSTGNTFRSAEAYRSGEYGLKFQGGGSGNLGLSHPLAKTLMRRSYVLSLYIKPVNAASGATFKVGFWDDVNNRLTNAQDFNISGTKEWSRIEVKFDNTSGWSGDKWFPMIQVYNLTSGNLYIDDVQLEEGTISSIYHYAGGGGIKDTAASLADGGLIVGTDGTLHPGVKNGGSLGTANSKFKELHLKNASIDENGGLTVASFGGAGNMTLNGNITLGDQTSDIITVNGRFNTSLIPRTNNAYDFGDSTLKWKDLYIDGYGYIDSISLQNGETITNSTNSIIAFTGVGGSDNTDLSLDLDGTYPVIYSATDGNVGINDDVIVLGTTPQVTIGDAGAEDTLLVYDGNAQDFYIALMDALDDLLIGTGSTPGANVKMTIENGGNVGIGTTAPSGELQVAGTTPQVTVGDGDAEDSLILYDGNAQDFYFSLMDTLDDFLIGTGSTVGANVKMTIENGGNVGIGTTAPGAALDVALDAGIFVGVDDDLQITVAAAAATGVEVGDIYFKNATSNANIFFNVNDGGTDTEVIYIEGDSGYVGIGTTNPGAKLQVGTLAGLGVDAANGLAIAGDLEVEDYALINSLTVGSSASDPGDNNAYIAGTLNVDGAVTLDAAVTLGDASGDTVTANADVWTFANATTVDLASSAQALNIEAGLLNLDTSSTRVGIGTTAPGAALDVALDAGIFVGVDDDLKITVTGTATGGLEVGDVIFRNATSNANIFFNVNDGGTDTEVIYIEGDSGYVGIGTTNPDQKLDVVGNIEVTGNFMDTGVVLSVPDYVFEVGYDLPTLAELSYFVKTFKHLPNIPDMEDIEGWANISLNNRDMRLLEKIEESVLYTLQQEGRLVSLETIQSQYNQIFSLMGIGGVATESQETSALAPAATEEGEVLGEQLGAETTEAEELEVLTQDKVGELTVTALVNVQGNLVVKQTAQFEGELMVLADATFKGKLYLENGMEVKGDLVLDSAIVSDFVAGESLNTGDVVYISGNNRVNKASAASENSLPAVGIVASPAGAGSTVRVAIGGTVKGLSGLATGRRYFVSQAAGSMTTNPEGELRQAIGVARSDSELLVMPDLSYQENKSNVEQPTVPAVEQPEQPSEPVEPETSAPVVEESVPEVSEPIVEEGVGTEEGEGLSVEETTEFEIEVSTPAEPTE